MTELNFKKVGPTYIKAKDLEPGSIVVNGDKYIEKTQHTRYENAFTYLFKSEEGEVTGVYGTAALNRLMESVEIGQIVQIIYQGSNIIAEGPMKGKPAHSWDVLTATEN